MSKRHGITVKRFMSGASGRRHAYVSGTRYEMTCRGGRWFLEVAR